MPLTKEKTTIGDLEEKVKKVRSAYVGSTTDVDRRLSEHERDGRTGKFYYAETQNMKKAENKLLSMCTTCSGNTQTSSNAQESRGYVYVIV